MTKNFSPIQLLVFEEDDVASFEALLQAESADEERDVLLKSKTEVEGSDLLHIAAAKGRIEIVRHLVLTYSWEVDTRLRMITRPCTILAQMAN